MINSSISTSDFEKDLIWDELNLHNLVNSIDSNPISFQQFGDSLIGDNSVKPLPKNQQHRINMMHINDSLKPKGRLTVDKKLDKVFKKSSYNAIMNRYESVPHKPKSISPKKLDILADPIKGKYMNILKASNRYGDNNRQQHHLTGSDLSSMQHKSSSVIDNHQKGSSGFFLTATDDVDDSDQLQVATKGNASQLVANLRGRMQINASVLDDKTSKAPIQNRYNQNASATRKRAPTNVRKPVVASKGNKEKEAWKDIPLVQARNKFSKLPEVIPENKRKSVVSSRKVVSSGYGPKPRLNTIRARKEEMNSQVMNNIKDAQSILKANKRRDFLAKKLTRTGVKAQDG